MTHAEGTSERYTVREVGFDPERFSHFEGLLTLGSGLVHLRSSLCESLSDTRQDEAYVRLPTNVTAERHRKRISVWGTYLPPIVGCNPLLNTVIVNLPSPLPIEVWLDGTLLSVEAAGLRDHRRELDLQRAVLERRSQWRPARGAEATLSERRFVSRVRPNLVVQEVEVTVDDVRDGVVRAGVDGRVRTNGHDHFVRCEPVRPEKSVLGIVVETDLGLRAAVLSTTRVLSGDGAHAPAEAQERAVFDSVPMTVGPDRPLRVVKYSVVVELPCAASDNRDPADAEVLAPALHMLVQASEAGPRKLLGEHEQAWAELWVDAEVTIAGGTSADSTVAAAEIDRSLRISVYHLLRAHRSGVQEFAICPKGHAGEAYFGRYFWDTEIYLLPFFIYTDPTHARDLLRFRINTLNGARRNAKRYGGAGARFAWESSVTGDEECPNWQYADHEIHVTADVVYGIMHYVRATGDEPFLYDEAAQLIVEAARYYRSRLDRLPDGSVHLLGVMGPDEYSPFSRNNAFTNHLVRFTFVTASDVIRKTDYGSENEADEFHALADALPVPIDSERGVILQSEEFERYPPLDPGRFDSSRPIGMQASQELLYRRKALKQADVVALLALFPSDFPAQMRERSFDYYEPLTTHDSSLSPTTHALVAAELGRAEQAIGFLSRSIGIDTHPQTGDASQGLHIANAGGHWQVIVHGILGVRPAAAAPPGDTDLVIRPVLPVGIGRIAATVRWRGTTVGVEATGERVTVAHRGGAAVTVRVCGRSAKLSVGESVVHAWQQE